MLECLILGDSIAKGVSDVRKECVAYVQPGINSYNWLNKNVDKVLGAKTVIISLGSNDYKELDTYEELDTLRRLVSADRVYWILPNVKETKRKAVWMIAQKYGDHVIDARNHDRSSDTVHPTYSGYKTIANETKN
jgi:lysophospholipase L1-like esterase